MNQTIRIVTAVVDTRQLTLYKENGETFIIPQGDPRLRFIIDQATPQLMAQGWADVQLAKPEDNSYAQFEEKTGGLVKFFRVAKDKLKKLFKPDDPVAPMEIYGQHPNHKANLSDAEAAAEADIAEVNTKQTQQKPVVLPPSVTTAMNVIDEIMSHAVPVSDPQFNEEGIHKQGNVVEEDGRTNNQRNEQDDSPSTIIAVVDGKVIPGMEKIKTQFGRAAKLGSTVGVENFLKRIAAVIDKRSHSVEDLLKFLERGDLPIADDGSIIIYKLLYRNGDKQYVDCHSRNVKQFVGAFICMDESLVDRNRNNECSNGLHVARRGYLSGFSGDVCVLAKLAPEDVIAVPTYDANKMRVCGYHIVAELSSAQFQKVKSNKAITDDQAGKELLAKVMSGDHIRRTHEVRITQQKGGGLVTKPLDKQEAPAPVKTVDAPKEVVALSNSTVTSDVPLDPKAVVAQVAAQPTRKEQAKVLYDACAGGGQPALDALHTFKKAAKCSWETLCLPELNGSTFSVREPVKAKPVKQSKKQKAKAKAEAKKAPAPAQAKQSMVAAVVQATQGEGSARERIQKMLALGRPTAAVATQILTIKKNAKKSWQVLGVSDADVQVILKLTGV